MKKRAVLIIAAENFRDEELLEPKAILEKNGIEVKVASTIIGQAKGKLGASVKTDMLISDINSADFDAVVFIGGPGAVIYIDDPVANKVIADTLKNKKVLAAICIAPAILAKAGALKDKRATVWESEGEMLKTCGARYTGKDVEQDGNIITAAGPFAAKEFAETIVKELK